MFKLENVDFSYEKGNKILKNISINIKKGEKVVFLGENGSGKSTLFFILNGLLKKESGEIYLKGEKIEYKKEILNKLRKKVGIIFQDPDVQLFAPTVYQEIAYGLENLGYNKKEIEKRVYEVLKELDIENLKEKPCHHLSYGQKKRVSIASILAMEPEILILDEPTAWLDSKNIKKVNKILNELHKKEKTLIISTHDIDFAYEIADYIYVLNKGEIIKHGDKKEVFNDFEIFKKLNLEIPNILKIQSFLEKKGVNIEEYNEYIKENF